MKLLKTVFNSFSTIALGVLGMSFMPTATAALISSYEAAGQFAITLNDVRDTSGNRVTSGWDAAPAPAGSDGGVWSDSPDIQFSQDFNYDTPGLLSFGDSFTINVAMAGTASDGTGGQNFSLGYLFGFSNNTDQSLVFSIDYDILLSTMTSGDANALVEERLFDHGGGLIDINDACESSSGMSSTLDSQCNDSLHGTVFLTVNGNGLSFLEYTYYNYGDMRAIPEVSAVPEPSTLLLLATSLTGLGFASRKKQV